jgi:hypothetical protein
MVHTIGQKLLLQSAACAAIKYNRVSGNQSMR